MADADDSHVVQHSGNVAGLKLTLGISLCYTLCVACLRGYIRRRTFGRDDAVVLVSTIVYFLFIGVNYASAAAGLGKPLDEVDLRATNLQALNRQIIAGNISWTVALCLSKIAIVLTLLRTTQALTHQKVQYATIALVTAQCIATVTLITARCIDGDQLYWDLQAAGSTCPAKKSRWLVITILDCITEVILLALPLHLVWGLRMSTRNKAIVISAFWLRFPTLIFTVLRDRATYRLISTADISRTAAIVLIWQTVEVSYSLAAVTIASLRRFTESLNTGFGHGELIRVHGSSFKMSDSNGGANDSNASRSRPKQSKHTNTNIDSLTTYESEQELAPSRKALPGSMKLRPEHLRNTTKITSTKKRPRSTLCTRQNFKESAEDGIIRQQVQYSVHYDQDDRNQSAHA